LGKDQDSGGELDTFGDARQVGEHHERVVERIVLGVRAGQRRRPARVDRAEHVVIGQQVIETQAVRSLTEPPDRDRVASELDLRIHNPDLHVVELSLDVSGR
jgi:hypothetical protein